MAKKELKQIDVSKVYVWEARNNKGVKRSGENRAENLTQMKSILKEQGLSVLKIKEKKENIFTKFKGSINSKDISLLTRQLATLIKSGVPLVKAFGILIDSTEKQKLKELLTDIRNEISSGTPFTVALRKHGKYFDDLFCSLVEAGEQSGSLEEIFESLAIYKEKTEMVKAKIRKAMAYPLTVLFISFCVTILLLVKVVPQFQMMFESFGGKLPYFTQLVVNMSDTVKDIWPIIIGTVVGAIIGVKQLNDKSQKFRERLQIFSLKVPIFNNIVRKSAIARYSRTLATTFKAGVPLIYGLESAAGASGNIIFKDAILKIREDVMTGQQLNFSMAATGLFPPMITQMVSIGEESGNLEEMLSKAAALYEEEVDNAVDALTSMTEPLIMTILGVLVGGLIIAMYLPVFKMGSAVK
jgi:type IV pilus assembly protein PilC